MDPGGFDAGSYRSAAQTDSTVQLTPMQKKLAKLEQTLPAALRRQVVAAALAVVVIVASAVGFGGAKLKAKYNTARSWYSQGLSADGGYTLSDLLATRENTAANVLTTASATLADSAEYAAAKSALDKFALVRAAQGASGGDLHAMYEADTALGLAIDQLYAKLQEQAADPMKMGAVQGQYGQFNSAATIIGNLSYNKAVTEYEDATGGFPASLFKAVFGIGEVEVFA